MIVYLLHYAADHVGSHYLGVAEDEAAIPLGEVPHGQGARHPAGATVADVWEVADAAQAGRLRAKLARQGSRARLCSICSPGNARGAGRGNWLRGARQTV